jgi:hypothetical protein
MGRSKFESNVLYDLTWVKQEPSRVVLIDLQL